FFLQHNFLAKFFPSFLSLIHERIGIFGVSEERVGRLDKHAIQNVFFGQGIGVCAHANNAFNFFLRKGLMGVVLGPPYSLPFSSNQSSSLLLAELACMNRVIIK
ncbi:hypothetical protein VIGAN_04240700, partial [Vigna angularis var. angularis]